MLTLSLSLLSLLALAPAHSKYPTHAELAMQPTATADDGERAAFRMLRTLTVKARRGDRSLSEHQIAALPILFTRTHRLRALEPALVSEINMALFELAALEWVPSHGKSEASMQICAELGAAGRLELERYLTSSGESGYLWMAESILGNDRSPVEPRIVAAKLLRGKQVRSTRQALMYTARTGTLDLREAALEALVGWDDDVVSHFFLEFLAENGKGIQYLARHFSSFNRELKPRVEKPLLELCESLYRSQGWRDASRARYLIPCLPRKKAIPVLLDALVVWKHRMGTKLSSKRVLWEVCDELRRLSGTSLKPEPDLWQTWWQGIKSGRLKLPGLLSEGASEPSLAGFYGLQPITDRVLFLIDRSGSMNDRVGSDNSSRYDEALGQFVDYMNASGPETWFTLVLFSDETRVFSHSLRKASVRNVESARRWLAENGPSGGTYLHAGLSVALNLGPGGRIMPKKVQADTVIVLCDGATAEGPDWVSPWLKRWNDEAQIVFQCVEIGNNGDGTLRALAEYSGGDYVRVQR